MKKRTLQLLQFFLLIFAFYALYSYSGNQRLLVSLACLVMVFVTGKVESALTEQREHQRDQRNGEPGQAETKTASQGLDWLLKSKNVLLLTDAIQYLFQDLGLIVSPSPDNRAVDRLVRMPGMQTTWGLTILSDVGELNENWEKWEELAAFEQGKDGKQRSLIIASNCIAEGGDPQQRYGNFSASTQGLLSIRRVVAMTTLTLCKIYLLSKKKGVDIKTIFRRIQDCPSGVFQLEMEKKPLS